MRDAREGSLEVKQEQSGPSLFEADFHALVVDVDNIVEHATSIQKSSLHLRHTDANDGLKSKAERTCD